jgi:hypothetical protein
MYGRSVIVLDSCPIRAASTVELMPRLIILLANACRRTRRSAPRNVRRMSSQTGPEESLSDSGFPPNDERAPICPACGVTMAPAALSAWEAPDRDWACLECEETAEPV